jgi:hypothetical protein
MNNKMILTEWYELSINDKDKDMLNENEQHSGPFVLPKRLLQKANTKNHNGRIYPPEVLSREISKYKSLVQERRALGELDHPESPVVELKNAALLITEISMNDKGEVIGDVEILDTPQGNILKNLIKQRVKLGISSRGLGSLQNEGDFDVVQDDFELIAFDAVSSPSTPGAYLVTEGKTYTTDIYNELRSVHHSILKDEYFNI